MDWKQVWLDNYNGVTDESKELESKLKKTYKGFGYIPWATMVRLMLMQDVNAKIDIVLNNDGTPLFTSMGFIMTNDGTKETEVTVMTHFVKVICTFMEKTFVEVYPVQDKSYDAKKVVDQNEVNKAVQRAKAKVISLATGLAFRLYEAEELQFDDTVTTPDNNKPAKTPKVEVIEPIVTGSGASTTKVDVGTSTVVIPISKDIVDFSAPHMELAKFIHDNKIALDSEIKKFNTSLVKNFKTSIDLDKDDVNDIYNKVCGLTRPTNALKALEQQLKK